MAHFRRREGEEEEIEGEEYPDRSSPMTPEEAVLHMPRASEDPQRCPSFWNGPQQQWVCTLRTGHPGRHVGGFSRPLCGARWQEIANLNDLDCGPDDGA